MATPRPKTVAPPEPKPDTIVVPSVPTVWTPATLLTFAAAVAALVLGILMMLGHVLPASVSADVKTWAGTLTTLVGLVTPLVVMLSKNSVAKAAVAAGVCPETVRLP